MAFQIIDDLLDLDSNAEVLGKSVGKDDRAGKLTYPSLLGSEAARQKVRQLSEQAASALKPLGMRGKKLLSLAQILAHGRRLSGFRVDVDKSGQCIRWVRPKCEDVLVSGNVCRGINPLQRRA